MKTEQNDVNKPPFRWFWVNVEVLFIMMMLSCWLFCGMPLTGIFLLAAVVLSLLAGVFVRLQEKHEKFGKAGRVIRTIALVLTLLSLVLPYGRKCFDHTKVMYPVKRFMYTGSLIVDDYFYLPYSLPKKCDDYIFITEFASIMQDSHSSAYLAFYTDDAGIDKYLAYFTDKGYKHCIVHSSSNEGDPPPTGIPGHVFNRIGDEYTAVVKEPELYMVPERYPKGFFFDRGTGLVIIWT